MSEYGQYYMVLVSLLYAENQSWNFSPRMCNLESTVKIIIDFLVLQFNIVIEVGIQIWTFQNLKDGIQIESQNGTSVL